jgi:glucose-1-phosphate thymidylyltransferase
VQVLLPMGGRGTRVRPHTHVRPKPLMSIAGKPILQHILDDLMALAPSEFIFITTPGPHGEQVRAFVQTTYPELPARYLVQEQALGQAHAVALAEPFVREPLFIMFSDTLFEADLETLKRPPGDGAVVTHHVDDPSRFGVVVTENGRIVRFAEKPREPISHDAIIGVYVINRPDKLFRAIRALLAGGIARNGEYFLADALQLLVDEGGHLAVVPASVWQDTGTIEAILGSAGPPFQALHYLLERHAAVHGTCERSVIVPPVYLGPGATVTESVIGPYVSVEAGATIHRSVVRQSIIGRQAQVQDVLLENSLIGEEAQVRGRPSALNISDHSSVST